MTPQRWKQIEAVFERALELAPERRAAFLQSQCEGDEELRCEVDSLFDSHARAGSFIDERSLFLSSDLPGEHNSTVTSGQVIGSYRVLREIGRGGMGAVYLAERAHGQFEKWVAIKVIKRGMDSSAILRHFRNERQILATLDHPNIARLLDSGTTADGLPYFVMEYIEGASIDKYCDAQQFSVQERLTLFGEVCAAVAYAHRHAVIHRDIKPSNILISAEGRPKLLDFGIAKALQQSDGTQPTATLTVYPRMTPEYASPEQLRGERLTPASDIYSLGVVLYQLLTGRQPYRLKTRTPEELFRAITEQEPTRPSTAIRDATFDNRESVDSRSTKHDSRALKGDLDNIVLMALRKEPERRYQSVEQLSEDIRRHLAQERVLARKDTVAYRTGRFVRRNPALAGAAAICLLLLVTVVWLVQAQLSSSETSMPQKSIAVLPFENLSKDPDNTYFTNGVQDEILTALARIAELKVISRTSVTEYKSGVERDMREISQQLGVANVLEGSVQRSGNRVRVNVQLVNARTDAHLWAESYDRDLADVFAIESEIARTIADRLKTKLSPSEKAAIAQPPTKDLAAFLLYNRAKSLIAFTSYDTGLKPRFLAAIDLLNQAVARDPSFFLAYCQLAYSHDKLYFLGYDHTPARLRSAETAIQAAFHLRPNAGEAHLARGEHLARAYLKYDQALAEIDLARRTLPNDPRVFELTGFIQKHRQGKYEEAVRNFERAATLDPRNLYPLQQIAITQASARHYVEQAAAVKRCLAVRPNDNGSRIAWARLDFDYKADPHTLHRTIEAIRTENPAAIVPFADNWFVCALAERDPTAANAALDALGENTFGDDAVQFSRSFGRGLIARMSNNPTKARDEFTAARAEQEKQVQAQPSYGPPIAVLGLIDAGLGRKEDALREGRRAMELMPLEKDSIDGMHMIENFAIIAAWTGEKDLACEHLGIATRLPGYLSYGQLKLLPYWDPLRGDPCFEKIVASLAVKPTDQVIPSTR